MPDYADIHTRQGDYLDSMVSAFETHLEDTVDTAQANLIAGLVRDLEIDPTGIVLRTPANIKVLRRLNDLFMKEMDKAGFSRLLNGFTNEFSGQITFLDEIIDRLSSELIDPLPKIQWSTNDINAFSGIRVSTVDALRDSVESAAIIARNRVMFAIGGMPLKDMILTLTATLKTSVARATTIADTSMSIFYRTASDRAFSIIEDGLPDGSIRYKYSGPNDAVTRPFCRLRVGRISTKDQIDGMSNGQLPNVWITGGGWNCRHQWVVEVISAKLKKAA